MTTPDCTLTGSKKVFSMHWSIVTSTSFYWKYTRLAARVRMSRIRTQALIHSLVIYSKCIRSTLHTERKVPNSACPVMLLPIKMLSAVRKRSNKLQLSYYEHWSNWQRRCVRFHPIISYPWRLVIPSCPSRPLTQSCKFNRLKHIERYWHGVSFSSTSLTDNAANVYAEYAGGLWATAVLKGRRLESNLVRRQPITRASRSRKHALSPARHEHPSASNVRQQRLQRPGNRHERGVAQIASRARRRSNACRQRHAGPSRQRAARYGRRGGSDHSGRGQFQGEFGTSATHFGPTRRQRYAGDAS